MRKRTVLGMAVTALACGMMAAALCPGTALAKYAPTTLTAKDISSATTIQAGQTIKASVTNANASNENNGYNGEDGINYCEDASVVKFYKLTTSKDGDYCFYSSGDSDMWCGFYTWDGTSATYNFSADDEGAGDNFLGAFHLNAGEVYYAAVCTYCPNENWSASLTFSVAKVAASVSFATVAPGSDINTESTKVTFTYTDKTSEVVYMAGTNTCRDNYGNYVTVEFNDDDDEDSYDDCDLGTYNTTAHLYNYNRDLVDNFALTLSIVDTAKVLGYTKSLPFGTSVTPGVYKFTAQADGIIAFNIESARVFEMSGTTVIGDYLNLPAMLVKGRSYFVSLTRSDSANNVASFYTANNNAAKLAQTVTAKVKVKTYKAAKLKKKKATFKIGASAKTAVSYKVVSGKKYLKVSKTGVVTVKKGAKKGTYKVQVTAAANGFYKAATKIIMVKVK